MTCIATTLVFGYSLHGKIGDRLIVVSASAASVSLYQLFAYVDLGYLDPFFYIAVMIQAPSALAIGAATLWLMRKVRRTGPQKGSRM